MPTLSEIMEEIKVIDGGKIVLNKREIKELPKILWENEHIEKIAPGYYSGGWGIIAATSERLLFIDKGITGSLKIEDFPYSKINSIQFKTGMLMGQIEIFSSGNKAKIENIDKKLVPSLAEHVRAKITSTDSFVSKSSGQNSDIISNLERLAKLKEQGILTDEEFAEQKRKILSQ